MFRNSMEAEKQQGKKTLLSSVRILYKTILIKIIKQTNKKKIIFNKKK